MSTHRSFCRLCLNGCALVVEVEDGRAVKVGGDKANPVYRGFTCVKGREQGRLLADEARLRHSLKRGTDGILRPIPKEDAIAEIAERLDLIRRAHGSKAIAGYIGTMFAASAATMPLFNGFMAAIDSPMVFSPGTIDKPGKKIAQALHGDWGAPAVGFDDPEVILLVGANPLVTFTGFPYGNPGKWLGERLAAGTRLIVIDPRRTDVARRAHIHLQARAGTDTMLVAAIIRQLLAEGLHDAAFVDAHCDGLAALIAAVAPFTPDAVAGVAGVDPDELVAVARVLGSTRRGYIMGGTGPNMAGSGTLVEYLLLNLHTLCGYWLREGDLIRHPGALAAPLHGFAEVLAHKPAHGFGEPLGVRGLANTAAGLPTGALPDMMLADGPGRIRALISCGGNPAAAWPDQEKTIAALGALDLLVQIDPWMSSTSKLADYVIAPQMWLEVCGTSQVLDWLTRNGTGYGQSDPYACYSPAILAPPAGSDLIEEWAFFYELARALDLPVSISPGLGPDMPPVPLDMTVRPSTDDILSILCRNSRVDLETVKSAEGGAIYPGQTARVAPRRPGSHERFHLADAEMMADLAASLPVPRSVPARRFVLLCRRMMHVYNSSFVGSLPSSARPYNPVFMHPDDMAELNLVEGALVAITSDRATISGVVHPDDTLRPGCASMSFGFGALPNEGIETRLLGSNPAQLLDNDVHFDRYSGQPLMTNVPVDIASAAA